MSGRPAEPQLCVSCRLRPAAYVLDRLDRLGRALSGSAVAFPVWACEDCVPHLLGQVLDVVSAASVCRIEAYQQARASL
jgi:hypothetical protein